MMSSRISHRFALLPLVGLAALAHANITSFSAYGFAHLQSYRFDTSIGGSFPYSNGQQASYLSFVDPMTTVTDSAGTSSTYVVAMSNLNAFSSTSVQMDSQFRGHYTASGTGPTFVEASGNARQEFTFTVDSASQLHIQRTPYVENSSGYGINASYIFFDGNYYSTSTGPQNVVVSVGPGTYWGYYEDDGDAAAGYGGSFPANSEAHMDTVYNFELSSQPTPEPFTLSSLAIGVGALLFRKRRE